MLQSKSGLFNPLVTHQLAVVRIPLHLSYLCWWVSISSLSKQHFCILDSLSFSKLLPMKYDKPSVFLTSTPALWAWWSGQSFVDCQMLLWTLTYQSHVFQTLFIAFVYLTFEECICIETSWETLFTQNQNYEMWKVWDL